MTAPNDVFLKRLSVAVDATVLVALALLSYQLVVALPPPGSCLRGWSVRPAPDCSAPG